MTKLLYLNASPRGDDAASTQAAQIFIDALPDAVQCERIDLFDANLPDLTAEIASAKQKFPMGIDLGDAESRQWARVVELVEAFKDADHYLFGLPMWNFSIPYRFKHYIDIITHPGLLFSRDANGIHGLASGSATVIYSRGGDYSPKDGAPDPYDFQSPYVKAWLGLVGARATHHGRARRLAGRPGCHAAAVAGTRRRLPAVNCNQSMILVDCSQNCRQVLGRQFFQFTHTRIKLRRSQMKAIG